MREYENRIFGYAVLASIVAHAALLFAVPWLRESDRGTSVVPGPVVVRLVQVKPAPAQAPPTGEAPRPRMEPPQVPVAKPVPAPLARSKPELGPEPRVRNPVRTASEQSAASTPPADTASTTSAAPSAAPGALARIEPKPAAPRAEIDLGSVREYQKAVAIVAQKYKRYPRVAMDNNWEGSALVIMAIGTNGMISFMSVETGTGYEVLDAEALAMVRKAKPLVPIPAALQGKEFETKIRVIFELKDSNS